jgi:hypothetical protein
MWLGSDRQSPTRTRMGQLDSLKFEAKVRCEPEPESRTDRGHGTDNLQCLGKARPRAGGRGAR